MKKLRFVAILLTVLMLLPMCLSAASAAEKNTVVIASGVDRNRMEGELIIFTPARGETTKTNTYGYEVVVSGNKCIAASKTGSSTIPADGFVLSGHDDPNVDMMATWLEENIKVGDYVFRDGMVITVSNNPDAQTVFYSTTQTILGANRVREADSIVIYNSLGNPTDTNPWGFEVVVTGGVITSIGGNNNTVPEEAGSFVISAHGVRATWLQNAARLGMTASYSLDNNTVTIAYDEKAAIAGAELKINALKASVAEAKANYDYFDFVGVEAKISALEDEMSTVKSDYAKSKNRSALAEACDAVMTKAAEISTLVCESRPVEYRAVWVRPTQTSAEEVDAYVDSLYKLGINTICVETLYDNCMIMPMPEGSLFVHHPKFGNFDVLQAFIDSCHKRGMELHSWMPVSHVGNYGSKLQSLSVGFQKPEWLSKSSTGETYSVCENYLMLDLSNLEVQAFLLETYEYILEKYDIDSLQLDYIRYFTRSDVLDMGYNEHTVAAFKEKYGITPEFDINASYWDDWTNFRAQYITDFIHRIRNLIDRVRPDCLLGADVVPDPVESLTYNYQNFVYWLEQGWIDILFPMSYNTAYLDAIAEEIRLAGDRAFAVVGLGAYVEGYDASTMLEHTTYCQDQNIDGYAYFQAVHYFSLDIGNYFQNGSVFRNDAITPYRDLKKAATAQLQYAADRVNNVFVPLGALDSEKGTALANALTEFANACTDTGYDNAALSTLDKAIRASGLSGKAKSRLDEDLTLVLKLYSVSAKEAFPETLPSLGGSEPADESDNSSASAEEESADGDSGEGKDGGSLTWLIITIAAVAVIAIGAIAVVLVKKKK